MKRFVAAVLAVSALSGLAGCASNPPPQDNGSIETFSIATGNATGNYDRAAIDLQAVLQDTPYRFELRETTGSIENIEAVGMGEANLGFSQLDTRVYLEQFGDATQQESLKNAQLFAPVSNEVLHLIVRRDADIDEPADLVGKRVSIGSQGSGTFVTAFVFYSLHGLDPDNEPNLENLNIQEAVEGLVSGELDAMFYTTALGSPLLTEISAEVGEEIQLLALVDRSILNGLEGIYQPTTIPANTYPWQTEDVPTYSTYSFILVDRNLETQTVRELAKAIYGNAKSLQVKHSFWSLLSIDEAKRDITVSELDYHEGVKEFIAEPSQ
ncbi:MAG: TAXI family TRAP transporter solute-binding subunit [Cyanobacteria bacterium SID2]|nr:TAXI family TRAP transporter solute-binding subunit [Cyanobacteria bacterium SID2]MBP0003398.1 TAXI family TRAP transporter solute-binding subunit [Cyanobacteria bacterium SBC]